MSRRWTLVTGASSGIGRELARLFAADGDNLILLARREDRLLELEQELEAAHGIDVRTLDVDLADPAAPEAVFNWTVEQGIAVHTLVNNAGFGARGRFATLPADLLDEMVRVNVSAVTGLSRMFLPGMLERGEGGILNVASMAAFQAGPYMGVYFATKSYVLSISEAIHEETLGRGVTISVLCPGPVATEFAEVADIEGSRLFKNARDVKSVALDGYRGYRAGRLIVIPGIFNQLGIFFSRFAPRAMTRKISGKLHRVGA